MYAELREVWEELTGPGGPFEVREIEVRGVSIKTYANAPRSLRDLWLASAAHGDADYLVYEDERWSYSEAHQQVASLASWLVANGVSPGDRVAIAMRNYPEWMLAYWATISVGAAAVGMNAWWTEVEMAYAIEDATPKVLICDQERLARFLPSRAELPTCLVIGVRLEGRIPSDVVDWREACLGSDGTGTNVMPEVEVDADEDASIFYTSGTTGRPKGAQLTHRGCLNNLFSLAFWSTAQMTALQRANASAQTNAPTTPPMAAPLPASHAAQNTTTNPPQLSSLLTTPLFHVTANNCAAQSMTMAGGKLVHMYKWAAGDALMLIERERITNVSGVPVMARELIAHPDFEKTDTSSMTALGGGGAQLQPDLVAKIDKTVSTARPSTGYGMTETCGVITANSADFFVDKPESVGPALPVFDTKCIDSEGKTVAIGEVGELCVRGGQVIRGYMNQPEATAEAIQDGWLRTGDIAKIDDDGFIFIVDRAKDMVLRGGENVYCAEVEAALFDHPAVAECAVFGVPDDRLGEEVAAAVVLNGSLANDTANNVESLRDHCATRLASYKIPRYIWLLNDPLPQNASGKFLKRQLREELDVVDAL